VDLDRPVGLLLVAILHFIADDDDPGMLLHHLIHALPAGSYLVLSHATFDPLPRATIEALTQLSGPDADHGAFHPRSRCQVDALLHGLTLIEPGLVPVGEWRPDKRTHIAATFDQAAVYAAVASVP
jgi:hypothetical protein